MSQNVQQTDTIAPNSATVRQTDRPAPNDISTLMPFTSSDEQAAAHAQNRAAMASFAAGIEEQQSRDLVISAEGGPEGFGALLSELRTHVPKEDWPLYQSLLNDPRTRPDAPRHMRAAIKAAKLARSPIR